MKTSENFLNHALGDYLRPYDAFFSFLTFTLPKQQTQEAASYILPQDWLQLISRLEHNRSWPHERMSYHNLLKSLDPAA